MGRVRKRRSSRHGTRYLAIARLDGTDTTVGTYETFEEATDAWQRAGVDGRRRTGGGALAATRITFGQLVTEYFASASLEATTRKAYRWVISVYTSTSDRAPTAQTSATSIVMAPRSSVLARHAIRQRRRYHNA